MDIEALLPPLAAEAPAGADLSFSSEFDAIQELRRRDDPTLSQGEWVTELKTADWPGVAKLCTELLRQRTRDLRVAAWWAEAQAQLQGYAGLADGLALTAWLCEHQWPELHPQPEDGEFELRTGSLIWLLNQVQQLARALPVLQSGSLSFSLQQIEAARLSSADTPGDGALGPDQLARALRETPPARIGQARDDARRAQAALLQLQILVDAQLGAEGPGFSAAKQALADALTQLDRLARDAGWGSPAAAPSETTDSPAAGGVSPGAAMSLGAGGPPASRAQALQQLREVADFFRRTEPHSPVAYLADKAARWGEMPLHAWLRTVMKDPGALAQLEDLLGVEPPNPGM